MDSAELLDLIDELESNIDDLEEALSPVLINPLAKTASKLPLLDKAKLHVLVTYAVESILFSYLRLNGTDAKEHPVFEELTRVRQYFEKIKSVEISGQKPNMVLDRQAAGRFIKAGLSGNDKYDRDRAARQAQEKKAAHLKFEELSKQQHTGKRKADEADGLDQDSEGITEASLSEDRTQPQKVKKPKQKAKTRSKIVLRGEKIAGKVEKRKAKKKSRKSEDSNLT